MKTKPFKNRELDVTKPFSIYRCLNRKDKVYSIQQDNLVAAHTNPNEVLKFKLLYFKINNNGRLRALREGVRNVHAKLVVVAVEDIESASEGVKIPLGYDMARGCFIDKNKQQPINAKESFNVIIDKGIIYLEKRRT